jgi:hypothetical protein
MVLRIILLFAVTAALGCGAQSSAPATAAAPEAPPPEKQPVTLDAELHEKIVRSFATAWNDELQRWFRKPAEGSDALVAGLELTTAGARTESIFRRVLEEHGVGAEAFVAFAEANPRLLRARALFVNSVVSKGESELARLMRGYVGAGEIPAEAASKATSDSSLVLRAVINAEALKDPPWHSFTWADTDDLEALLGELRKASLAKRPVIVVFRADWSLPNKWYETKVFTDKKVQSRLEPYARLSVDVTDGREPQDRLQEAFAAESLPSVQVFADADKLEGLLRRTGKAPTADALFIKVIEPEELLATLDKAGLP